MTARSGMATVITHLRGLTEGGTADYTVAGNTYWSDDHLQSVLDCHRTDVYNELMNPVGYIGTDSVMTWTEYRTNNSGEWATDPIIQSETNALIAAGTANYTFDNVRGVVTFTADTKGVARYITGSFYNVNAAAADVWNQKAAHYAIAYDVSTDNTSVKRSQLIAQCRLMAQTYGQLANQGAVYMERNDV